MSLSHITSTGRSKLRLATVGPTNQGLRIGTPSMRLAYLR
jgi:hypothetical protein